MKQTFPRFAKVLCALVVLFVATFGYLYPGSQALFEGRTDVVLSDGTDPASLPGVYDRLIQVFKNYPANLFYGAVYDPTADGDRGTALWFPWLERWVVIGESAFFPVEQLSTAFSFTIIFLSGLCMFALGMYWGWGYLLSLALGFAWAFNPYTRARAKVHPALAGIYHLPLIFLGILLIARGKSWRSCVAAAAAFLFAATAAHYYLVATVLISPFFVIFLCLQPEFKKRRSAVVKRFVISVLPAIFFLGYSRWVVLPPEAKMTESQSMSMEWLNASEISPFLDIYKAHAIDYLGGDISLGSSGDLNFLRGFVNEYILANLEMSNAHERTNGVRWTILILLVYIGVWLSVSKYKESQFDRRIFIFLAVFGIFGFWMSLGPNAPIPQLSPAYWFHILVPKVRVPSRAGILFHFAALIIVGLFLSRASWFKENKWMPWVFMALMVLDYFPVQGTPMAQVQPAYSSLARDKGPCGLGMFYPFINPFTVSVEHYILVQRMRGSDCPIVNQISDPDKVRVLLQRFPPSGEFIMGLRNNSEAAIALKNFAACVPLNWVVFHPAVPPDWAKRMCDDLGWNLNADLTCVSNERNRGTGTVPPACL